MIKCRHYPHMTRQIYKCLLCLVIITSWPACSFVILSPKKNNNKILLNPKNHKISPHLHPNNLLFGIPRPSYNNLKQLSAALSSSSDLDADKKIELSKTFEKEKTNLETLNQSNEKISNNHAIRISYSDLKKQNAETSNLIINHYSSNPLFQQLAQAEGELIIKRDQEDCNKLQDGIDYAKDKGCLDCNFVPEPYIEIDVLNKSPSDVADFMISHLSTTREQGKDNNTNEVGSIIVLCGLSGTGKGTTVSSLQDKLQSRGKKVITWSNGNIFRSVTLLATTWCEQNHIQDINIALSKENIQSFMTMLSFNKHQEGNNDNKYDIHINGLGLDLYVSDIQNTLLKEPRVAKNIPTIAERIQGEVIMFASDAITKLKDEGYVVVLEGREQTVDYVRTPNRFTLTLSDCSLIGKRRAAQRLMALALSDLSSTTLIENDNITQNEVMRTLDNNLNKMVQEI